jgi:predicted phosphodiesterase
MFVRRTRPFVLPTLSTWPGAARWALLGLLAAAIVVAGMVVGWRFAGPASSETSIGRVAIEVHPSLRGSAEAIVPVADWGLRADAYNAPFGIRVELRSIERGALLRAAEGDLSVLTSTESELLDGVRAAVLRGFAWGGLAALALLALATLVWRELRPRWALLALGAGIGVIAAAASIWSAQSSFDARAFESPTYFAQGAELGRILEVAEDERVQSEYGSTFASVLRSITAVLADVPADEPPGRRLHLASDLHGNALVIGPLANAIGEGPLLLAGDFGQRGGETESALLAPRVAALAERVIAVSGNHDSRRLMQRLADEGVTVLHRSGQIMPSGAIEGEPVLDVDGLRVAGFPDPLEWQGVGDPPDRPVTFDDLPDPGAAFERAASDVVRWFDGLTPVPDIVMVHQNALARHLAETLFERGFTRNLTIATGHTHRQEIHLYGDVVVVDGGSVGAGGLFEAGRLSIGFAELNFAAQRPILRSVDLIAIEPFSGEAQASRVVIRTLCPGEDRCSFTAPGLEPTPTLD